MKLGTTIIFILLFGIVLWVFFAVPKEASKPVPPPASSPKTEVTGVYTVPPEAVINWLQIQDLPNRKIWTLVDEGGDWVMKFPVAADANEPAVDELIRALKLEKGLEAFRPDKNWEEYGLKSPRLKIGVQIAGQTGRHYLWIGDASPLQNGVFARWENDDRCFLVSVRLPDLFKPSFYTLREKKIFEAAVFRSPKVEFHFEASAFMFQRENGSAWNMNVPGRIDPVPVRAEEMETLLKRIEGLNAKDFLESGAASDAGLGEVPFVRLAPEEGNPRTLFLGKELGTRDAFFARRDEDTEILLIDRAAVFDLKENVRLVSELALRRADEALAKPVTGEAMSAVL
ncbi:MAG: DUF4340 domain-containing protein [Candidatus Omnitrophota bacterium]